MSVVRALARGLAFGAGAAAVTSVAVASAEDTTYTKLLDIADRVKRIEKSLGINAARSAEAPGAGFPRFTDACHSLIKKHLTPEIYDLLKDRVR